MVEVKTDLSNRIVRKGDTFNIYVDILNDSEETISLQTVKFNPPIQFTDLTEYGKPRPEADRGIRVRSRWLPFLQTFEWKKDGAQGSDNRPPAETSYKIHFGFLEVDWFIKKPQPRELRWTWPTPLKIAAHDNKRIIFVVKAYPQNFLTRIFHPRPDTYTISGEVEFEGGGSPGISFHKQIDVRISIYPSTTSMLGGTILGSLLGTFASNNDKLTLDQASVLIPLLFVNSIFSFIGGIVLMRKKDVQPFLTIEDFWGGILLGFVIAFAGRDYLMSLLGLNSNSG